MDELKEGLDKLWSLARIDNPEIKMLGGVSAGISYSFGIAPWIVRALFALSALFSFGTTIIIYLVLWLVLPKITVSKELFERRVSGENVGPVIMATPSDIVPTTPVSTTPEVIITPYTPDNSGLSEPLVEDAVVKYHKNSNSS